MREIATSRLRDFWEFRKEDADIAKRDLLAWRKAARGANWRNFAELRQTFGSADQVGNCIVFDVGNNRYRLVGRVFYAGSRYSEGLVYVLRVMDHAEYDKKRWIDECGCRNPPPKKKTTAAKARRSRNWTVIHVQTKKGERHRK